MGLAQWAARKGAVGGTARWVAKAYHAALSGDVVDVGTCNSVEDLNKIIVYSLAVRFNSNPRHPHANEIYSEWLSEETSLNGLGSLRLRGLGGSAGLLKFVEAILAVEASYTENSFSNINMFKEIIEDELRKNNISNAIIFGDFLVE
jgi:hypothetical protein